VNYIELDITVDPLIPFREIVTALLAEAGFESFTEYEKGLRAYIPEDDFDEADVSSILNAIERCDLNFEVKSIPQVNWNAEWEKQYEAVHVSEECVIRALFHEPMPAYKYELIIQPQMSFGTGHHPTTILMMKHLLEMDVRGQTLADLGSGTGVLAILAEKMGASDVYATDIEDHIVDNARSNVRHNDCVNIRVDKAALGSDMPGNYGIILANINLNTLLSGLDSLVSIAVPQASVVLSGFYNSDASTLIERAEEVGLKIEHKKTQDNWAALRFTYSGA
jgi:ribosomal protein L11 methyltransferase